jgi:hypothetical protein
MASMPLDWRTLGLTPLSGGGNRMVLSPFYCGIFLLVAFGRRLEVLAGAVPGFCPMTL